MKAVKNGLMFLIAAVIITGCIKQSETKDMSEKIEKVNRISGSLIKVRPEFEERYIILHKHTFPGVLESIRKSNIRNYSIFLLDGMLFSYNEYVGANYDSDMKAIGDETTKEWWKLTDPMQEPLPTRKAGEWWAEMELVGKITGKSKPYAQAARFGFSFDLKPNFLEQVKDLFTRGGKELATLLQTLGFQNGKVFFKDDRLYCYIEYTGTNIQEDWKKLSTFGPFIDLNKELNRYALNLPAGEFQFGWKRMKEVFHTN